MQRVLYGLLSGFLRLVTRVFFRSVEVVGRANVPAGGPVIFVGNHPNSLIDPVMITTTCGRRVRFAAKDTLFSSPFLRPFLWALGSVPIRRRMDHQGAQKLDNNAAFEALFAILGEGEAFGIFPEGISHSMSELQPLKTGAARIALGAAAQGVPVVVVPCGLSYKRRQHFRGQVLVQLGVPIVVDSAWTAAYARDERDAVTELTRQIDVAIRSLTLNAKDFGTLRVLDAIRRLYEPEGRALSLAEREEVTRRLVSHWEKHRDVPEVAEFYRDVEVYLALLDALGLSDYDLSKPVSRTAWLGRVARHATLMLVFAPLALPGLLLHFPVLFLAVRAGEGLLSRSDVVATMKMCVATVGVLFSYVVAALVTFALLPWPADWVATPIVLALLLTSGWATIRVLERQAVLRRGAWVFLRIVNMRRELEALRERRAALRTRLVMLVERYAEAGMQRIVSDDELRAQS